MNFDPGNASWKPGEATADEDRSVVEARDAGFDDAQPHAMLNRLQRNGAALAACECGSRHWLPPDSLYQLVAPRHAARRRDLLPITCAACGFVKLYDPAVAGR